MGPLEIAKPPKEIYAAIMATPAGMETLRLRRLRVSVQLGKEQVPPYKERVNYFDADEWSSFSEFVEERLAMVRDVAGPRVPMRPSLPTDRRCSRRYRARSASRAPALINRHSQGRGS